MAVHEKGGLTRTSVEVLSDVQTFKSEVYDIIVKGSVQTAIPRERESSDQRQSYSRHAMRGVEHETSRDRGIGFPNHLRMLRAFITYITTQLVTAGSNTHWHIDKVPTTKDPVASVSWTSSWLLRGMRGQTSAAGP